MLQYSYIFNTVAHFNSFANFIESSRSVGGAANWEVRKAFNNNRTARHAIHHCHPERDNKNNEMATKRGGGGITMIKLPVLWLLLCLAHVY